MLAGSGSEERSVGMRALVLTGNTWVRAAGQAREVRAGLCVTETDTERQRRWWRAVSDRHPLLFTSRHFPFAEHSHGYLGLLTKKITQEDFCFYKKKGPHIAAIKIW